MKENSGRFNSAIAAGHCSAPQVREKPSHVVGRKWAAKKAAQECSMVDRIEGLRKVNSHRYGPEGRTLLVESRCYSLYEWKQSSSGRAARSESMLSVSKL